jgi:crotonobetainyl-CoA:carnitine CoA-transferase CaiB-like acyl-CoA transferase
VVVVISDIYNGPYATFLMAMAGAEIIKIEPHGGEHLRHRAGLGGVASVCDAEQQQGRGHAELKSPRGHELLFAMVRKADVVSKTSHPASRIAWASARKRCTRSTRGSSTPRAPAMGAPVRIETIPRWT